MLRNPAEMTGYASLYPGIDHFPMRLPTIDKYGHAWCLACHGRNGRAVAGDGLCDTCRGFDHARPEHRRIAFGHGQRVWTCARCGQMHAVTIDPNAPIPPNVCEPCREADREPQGEAMRLFAPAPNQIPGQLAL